MKIFRTVGNSSFKSNATAIAPDSSSASAVAQSMKSAAELALSEFPDPNVQLLIKDDGGMGMLPKDAQDRMKEMLKNLPPEQREMLEKKMREGNAK